MATDGTDGGASPLAGLDSEQLKSQLHETLLEVLRENSLLLTTAPTSAVLEKAYITDVIVISGRYESIRPPAGYCKIPVDLNIGARGQYIFVCYNRGDDINDAITDLKVIQGYSTVPPIGYHKIDQDLSQGARGNYLYLCYSKSKVQSPITMIEVIQGYYSDIWPAESPQMIRIDVNCNPNGKFVYICYRR